MSPLSADSVSRIQLQLKTIYGGKAMDVLPRVLETVERYADRFEAAPVSMWTERDVALIAYGDQVRQSNTPTLATLLRFLLAHDLQKLFSIVHILPFCPYSSDDGFSVIDFRQVDKKLGDWSNIEQLAEHLDLMYDLVLNHVSQHNRWFQGYRSGDRQYQNWFHDIDPALDLSQVTRPRSHPLLTPFVTVRGERHLWTTFSEDQIDLNYAEPAVLVEMLDILLMYAARGARIIRLDAIAFLWKTIGTSCLHLEQTHAVVKLLRAALEAVAPHVVLLTETNVPHAENISYFGEGDEAHMVYNFSLPPLIFDAFVQSNAEPLQAWLNDLQPPAAGTTWFNFTASHDGIGVRPLEGLVNDERLGQLVAATRDRGGEVGMRQMPCGELSPYELNITWCDAMRRPGDSDPLHVRRILSSQAFMLALQGVPATYFHSLVGTPNDLQGMRESGQNRRINRSKYEYDELLRRLQSDPLQSAVFKGYRQLLEHRIQQPAFHPDGIQRPLDCQLPGVAAVERYSPDGLQKIVVIANFADTPQELPTAFVKHHQLRRDILTEQTIESESLTMQPCQTAWLAASPQ